MYTEIGAIESSSRLILNAAFFGGAELTGFDFAPALADLEGADPFFEAYVSQARHNSTGDAAAG